MPQPGDSARDVPFVFDGQPFDDPVRLAERMRLAWTQAQALFQRNSEPDADGLREWIVEELHDDSIDQSVFRPIATAAEADRSIITFTSRYLGAADTRLRGELATPTALARRFSAAGALWTRDPVLAALTGETVLALRDSALQKHRGADQSPDYLAFARYADQADRTNQIVDRVVANIGLKCGDQTGLAAARENARARIHAGLLDPTFAAETRNAFPPQPVFPAAWHAALHLDARSTPPGSPAENILKALYLETAGLAAAPLMPAPSMPAPTFAPVNRVEQARPTASNEVTLDRRPYLVTIVVVLSGVIPWAIGRFVLGTTVFRHSSQLFDESVVSTGDYVVPYFLFGLGAILLVLLAFLLSRGRNTPRTKTTMMLIIAALVSVMVGKLVFDAADTANVETLRTTPYPFSERHPQCGERLSVQVKTSQFGAVTDYWQLYLTRSAERTEPVCDTVVLYNGWREVGRLELAGEQFDDSATGLSLVLAGDSPYHGDREIWAWDPARAWLSAKVTTGRVVSVSLASAANGNMLN